MPSTSLAEHQHASHPRLRPRSAIRAVFSRPARLVSPESDTARVVALRLPIRGLLTGEHHAGAAQARHEAALLVDHVALEVTRGARALDDARGGREV